MSASSVIPQETPPHGMARNECGQRAAAALLARHGHAEAGALLDQLRASHPPDTPLRLLGTTPAQLARALRSRGLAARAVTHRDDASARATLLAGPLPALACVDLRPLGARWPMLHWVLVEAVDHESVTLSHLVRTGGARARVPWARFLRAWRCRVSPFPMHRRAVVLAS